MENQNRSIYQPGILISCCSESTVYTKPYCLHNSLHKSNSFENLHMYIYCTKKYTKTTRFLTLVTKILYFILGLDSLEARSDFSFQDHWPLEFKVKIN